MVLSTFAFLLRRRGRLVLLAALAACVLIFLAGYGLRRLNIEINPVVWASTQIIAAVLGFSITANVLLRFYGTGDRFALLVGLVFSLNGLIHLIGVLELMRYSSGANSPRGVPVAWMVAGLLLATVMLFGRVIEQRLPWPRNLGKTVGAAFAVDSAAALLVALVFLIAPRQPSIYSAAWVPRPWDLLPAGIFLAATFVLGRSPYRRGSAFDLALCWTAGFNTAAYLLASQSVHLLDAPAVAAQYVVTASYGFLLASTLLENARLFTQVRERATTDSLTGLANHERFVGVLQSELERSGRTNRSFSVLLMDMDGLKQINDEYGHLAGSESLCRLARILRMECRSIDTAARYGGDEFALILPETPDAPAHDVAARIQKRLASETSHPRLSVSIGIGTYPHSGLSASLLLEAADQDLYASKAQSKSKKQPKVPRGL